MGCWLMSRSVARLQGGQGGPQGGSSQGRQPPGRPPAAPPHGTHPRASSICLAVGAATYTCSGSGPSISTDPWPRSWTVEPVCCMMWPRYMPPAEGGGWRNAVSGQQGAGRLVGCGGKGCFGSLASLAVLVLKLRQECRTTSSGTRVRVHLSTLSHTHPHTRMHARTWAADPLW